MRKWIACVLLALGNTGILHTHTHTHTPIKVCFYIYMYVCVYIYISLQVVVFCVGITINTRKLSIVSYIYRSVLFRLSRGPTQLSN